MVQPSGFFDFIGTMPHYDAQKQAVARLNRRHAFLIDRHAADIAGARVLDLAAHDGRWAYAFAGAGAASVLGIEGRQDLIDLFAHFPDTGFKRRVSLRQGDIFEGMEAEIAAGRRYDVIGVLGIYYHIMDHFRLLQLVRKLGPKMVLIDSEFVPARSPYIQLVKERTDNVLNAIAQVPGQEVAIKGIPTFTAMEAMASVVGYGVEWVDWTELPPDQRQGVPDYFRTEKMRRATCVLRPGSAAASQVT